MIFLNCVETALHILLKEEKGIWVTIMKPIFHYTLKPNDRVGLSKRTLKKNIITEVIKLWVLN